jgi:hypothetical protein|nr:MAG TPA: hypothetical protein [Caudoviricetes sp.]
MDRDDMVDTGATVATAAGIRQARRKVYRKIYRTLYAGVPKRVGPIVALGSILSRFTKTAAPYDYTQIGYEGVIPSMISKEYYEKTAGIGSNLMNFVRGMRSRYNAAKAVKSVAKNNLEANLSRQNMLSKSIKRDYADLEALKNPAMRRNLGAGYDMYAKKNIDTLANRTYSNAAELNKLRSEQAGLQARVKETSSPLYAFKAALGRNKTAAALAPIRKIHKGVLRDMLDYKRMATAGWEKQVARNNIHDIIGGIRAGEAAQRASKVAPTATNYKAMMDASGIRNMDSSLHKKLRHRYGNI